MSVDVIEVEAIEPAELMPADINYIFTGEPEELFRVEIKRPCGDYFSCAAVMNFFDLSPTWMVETLREYKDVISIYSDKLTSEDLDWFYDNSNAPYNCVQLLDKSRFHYLEVRQLRLHRTIENSKAIESALKYNKEKTIKYDKSRKYLLTPTGLEALKTSISRVWGNEQNLKSLDEIFTIVENYFEDKKAWEQQIGEDKHKIAALESELAAARQQITELTTELNAAKVEPATTVNASKWKDSVSAAFGVWAEIVQGDKTDWKEEEFRAALVTRCAGYLTDVHSIAWRILPGTFKHGRGRPKKNPGNIQQSDNT